MTRSSHRHTHSRNAVAIHYPHSIGEHVWGLWVAPALVVGGLFILLRYAGLFPSSIGHEMSVGDLLLATALTFGRLLAAYALALVCAVPLALLATYSRVAQRLLLPVFDILQSVPILAFFPVVIVLFLSIGFASGAAIFILFLSMLWNIVFAIVGSIGLIPRDIVYAAEVFGIRGLSYLRRIVLPSIFPQTIVGSILAFAQGWNIIIVAEVLRTYLPPGSSAGNLFGLGSLLVSASAQGNTDVFIAALSAAVIVIALVNLLVWQRLLKYAQRFKFEQ